MTLDETVVHGSRERLHRAVSNLLDNAVKWSPGGGTVEVPEALRGAWTNVLTGEEHELGAQAALDDLPAALAPLIDAEALGKDDVPR